MESSAPKRIRARTALLVAGVVVAATVAAVVIVALVSPVTGSVNTKAAGAFYEAPGPLPEGEPGSVIRSESMSVPAPVQAPAGTTARRVLYMTTDPATGRHRAASGTVMTPPGRAPRGGRPVLAWAHATIGVAPKCAPSLNRSPKPAAVPGLGEFLRRGWVVASTDYPGLGTAGPNAYLVGDAEARSVLDSVRAARHLAPATTSEQAVAWGHSQGGQAALFAGQVAARYAPELELMGVAAAAPAAELGQILQADAGDAGFNVLAAYILWSWPKVVPGLSLDGLVGAPGRRLIDAISSRCLSGTYALTRELLAGEFANVRHVVPTRELLDDPGWARAATENTPATSGSGPPLFIAQGTKDPLVIPATTASFARRLCRAGRSVESVLLPGVGHVEAGVKAAPGALAWAQSLRREEPPPGCRVRRAGGERPPPAGAG